MTPGTAEYRQLAMAAPATRVVPPRVGPRSDDTRAALLAAAHDLLAADGPAALTVRRIATAAGMSTMNVYSRFGGKDGVVDELFVDGFRLMAEEMDASTPATDDPLADLRQCGRSYLDFARRWPTYYSLMFDRAVPEFEPSAHAADAAIAALGRVVGRVQRAMDAGVIEPGDAFTVASALWACMHGVASLEARAPRRDDHPFDWDLIAHTAHDAMVRGLATRSS